jgi:hypothetical protein
MWLLFPSCRKKKFAFLKPNESWSSVLFVDPFTIPLILIIRRFKNSFPFYMLTPNAISLFSFIIFFLMVASMLLYPQHHKILALGFIITSLFDLMDGQLARATGTASDFGALVDTFFDMFRTSIGLALIGLALCKAHHCFWIFPLMTFYSLIHGSYHMNHITKIVMNLNKPSSPRQETSDIPKTAWERFCDERGFLYNLFTEYEASVLIFLSIIFFQNPILPIAGIICFRLLYWPMAVLTSPKAVLKRLQ